MLNRRHFLQKALGTIVTAGPATADAAIQALTGTRPSGAVRSAAPDQANVQFRWASEIRLLRTALLEFQDRFLPLLLDRNHYVGTFPNFISYRATDAREDRVYRTAIRRLLRGVPADSADDRLCAAVISCPFDAVFAAVA